MYKRYFLTVIVGMVALLLGLVAGSPAVATQRNNNEKDDKPLVKKGFDRWEYEAVQIGPDTRIRISSSVRGKLNLKKLLSEHKKYAKDLFQSAQEVPVVILLNEAINPEGLTNFVKQYSMVVQSYTLLAQDHKGQPITFFGAPVQDQLFPADILQTMVTNLERAHETTITVKGIVGIEARVDAGTLARLNNDANVLGVDLTPALAMQDFKKQFKDTETSSIMITPAPFYWSATEN